MRDFFNVIAPHPSLRGSVRCLHFFHLDHRDAPVTTAKFCWPSQYSWLAFIPRGGSMVRYTADDRVQKESRTALVGQPISPTQRWNDDTCTFRFQVQFQPGALFRLTGIPAAELANGSFDAEAVFPGTTQVNEQLGAAQGQSAMIAIVEAFLQQVIRRPKRARQGVDRVAEVVARGCPRTSVDDMAAAACVSPRQLQRQFTERIGVGPRTYLRIARLNHALRLKEASPQRSWSDVASFTGYTDYQHMARDFQRFGLPLPGVLLDTEHHTLHSVRGFSGAGIW